jgi:hypothetical protein
MINLDKLNTDSSKELHARHEFFNFLLRCRPDISLSSVNSFNKTRKIVHDSIHSFVPNVTEESLIRQMSKMAPKSIAVFGAAYLCILASLGVNTQKVEEKFYEQKLIHSDSGSGTWKQVRTRQFVTLAVVAIDYRLKLNTMVTLRNQIFRDTWRTDSTSSQEVQSS